MADPHPSITRFRQEHERRGGAGEIVILPDSVHTAALAAAAVFSTSYDELLALTDGTTIEVEGGTP